MRMATSSSLDIARTESVQTVILREFFVSAILVVMLTFNSGNYGAAFARLLETDRRRPLDAGRPISDSLGSLRKLAVESVFAHTEVADPDMAECCIAGVWLLYDYLDESHTISQRVDTAEGSFWHAVMHRREADFSNSKYWFRHVGHHATYESIGQRAAERAATRGQEPLIRKLLASGAWDPFAFVDLCQAVVRGQSDALDICLDIQQAEWETLFDYCYRAAVSR